MAMVLTIQRAAAASVPVAAVACGVATVLALAAFPAGAASTDDSPAAVPYRPSVSTPAALSAPGWLEVEAGFLHEHDGAPPRRLRAAPASRTRRLETV